MYVKSLLTFVLLSMALMAAPANATSCSNLNPFLSDGAFSSLQLTSLTSTSSWICNGFWRTHQTCCAEHLVLDRANRNTADLNNYISWYLTRLDEIRAKIVSSASNPILNNAYLTFFKRWTSEWTYNNWVTQTRTCWDHLGGIRNSALCSICSGNSALFFNKQDSKAWVSMATCSTALKTCSVFLDETRILIGGTVKVLNYFNAHNPNILTWPEFQWTNHFRSVIANTDIMHYLFKFDNPLSSDEKLFAEVNLCNRILLLKRVPIIYHLADLLRNLNTGYWSIISTMEKIVSGRALRSLHFGSDHSRVLQIGDATGAALSNPSNYTFPEGDCDILRSKMASTSQIPTDEPMNVTMKLSG